MQRVPAVLLILTVLAGCQDSTGPSQPDYFPLEVGNSWTYTVPPPGIGDPVTWQVTSVRGDTVIVDRPAEGSHSGPVTLMKRADGVDILRDGPEPFYRFTVGAWWEHPDPWECDDGATYTVVAEPEPVVTPVGTFTGCLRVERRTTATCDDAGTMFEWWAPGVGLVKWEELNYVAGGTIHRELADYQVVDG